MAYLNKAIISGNKMNYDEAIEYCDKVIELYSELKDVALSLKENLIKQKNAHTDSDEFSDEARELIDRANALKEEDEYWQGDEHYNSVASETPKFKKITFWDAWELYEQAIKKDPKCESVAAGHITEIKSSLMENFLFFDITNHDDFNPQSERDTLKMKIMGEILISKGFLKARAMTSQLLTTDENDLDALNYKGALSFYYDDLDEAIECFDKLAQSGNGVYLFYGDFNRAFVLRRKAMLTGDLEYMVQALDIYDEMLKDSMTFDLVKPYQREILDKLQEFMNVPLF